MSEKQSVRNGEEDVVDDRTEVTDVVLPDKMVDVHASLDDRLTDNVQRRVGPARYFERDENGDEIEDWGGVFNRVASNVAEAEYKFGGDDRHYSKWSGRFEDAMRELRFMPNSPTLMNAGLDLQQLSACFVVEPKDDMEDIFQSSKDAAQIFKSGGGVGYAFHHLRPKGARVASTGGVSSGPLSFMQLFDTTCNTVKQGGKRRGAQMGIMHVQHPDIGRFAVSKRGEDNLSNFNISFGITDEFKRAVENDETYTLYDPTSGFEPSDTKQAFDVVPETVHFYDPTYEDAWNDEFDKPSVGLDGKVVEENFWRDYQDEMADPDAFDEYREWFEPTTETRTVTKEKPASTGPHSDQVSDTETETFEVEEEVVVEEAPIDLTPGEPMELPAGFIWQLLVDGAWNNGEPGVFYLDETNRQHSFDVEKHPDHYVHATNPCSEQPLEEYEACNLGHVNLSLMVDPNAPTFDEFCETHDLDPESSGSVEAYLNRSIDDETFVETVETGTRFLDNVVTQSEFPLDKITEQVRSKRKIGLGLMGFYQMLVQMGVEYGSDVSYDFAREIMRRIDSIATSYSHGLAEDRGVFTEYEESKWANPTDNPEWFDQHAHESPSRHEDGYEMRNHNVTTIAPTGTTSMIGNTTGGCEPLFQVAFMKNVGDDIQGEQNLIEFDDFFLRTLEANDVDVDEVKAEVKEQMLANEFEGADSLTTVPNEIGELFVTTNELSAEQHIRMQAAFQEYCDSGISKTINAPPEMTAEEIGDAFLLALDLGIKGTTVYRNGSRDEQVKKENVDEREFTEDEREEIVEQVRVLVEKDETAKEQLETLLNGGEN